MSNREIIGVREQRKRRKGVNQARVRAIKAMERARRYDPTIPTKTADPIAHTAILDETIPFYQEAIDKNEAAGVTSQHSPHYHEVHHIVELDAGGKHEPSNLVVITRRENNRIEADRKKRETAEIETLSGKMFTAWVVGGPRHMAEQLHALPRWQRKRVWLYMEGQGFSTPVRMQGVYIDLDATPGNTASPDWRGPVFAPGEGISPA